MTTYQLIKTNPLGLFNSNLNGLPHSITRDTAPPTPEGYKEFLNRNDKPSSYKEYLLTDETPTSEEFLTFFSALETRASLALGVSRSVIPNDIPETHA